MVGKYGDYRIVLTTLVADPGDKAVFTKQEVFSTQKNTGVPFQKTMVIEYPVSLKAGKVSATLTYQVPGRPPSRWRPGVQTWRVTGKAAFI
jgi:hypothetical protein